ncbi:HdeD family acid-resistance protein [Herbiconiux sp. L3-i23]|uniref:HdeD family acid-resistance protein n=1 Tax=Herbiconiux sp. L3-i23 TaxID=2905871 RepID=UPI00205F11CF|nr:DUF308 domain-containing protein [Herbiconiux sp. L3-i23]BDI23178.1 membrane protein [Herbiconiux sp. L3-i23]
MTTNPTTDAFTLDLTWLRRAYRGQLIAVAVIGLVLGIIGAIFPAATALTISIIFGAFLLVLGVSRIVSAIIAHSLNAALRWLSAIVGVLLLAVGVLCLADPFEAWSTLAIFIGIGWIIDGVMDIAAGVNGAVHPRWFAWVSGIISIAAGVAFFVLPFTSLALLVQIGSFLLIVVSLSTLLTLPRKSKAETVTA